MDKRLLLIVGIVMLIFAGCTSSTQTGVLQMKLTDAPTNLNIQKTEVTLSKISVHRADMGENESSWVTVVNSAQTYDLMKLVNTSMILGAKELGIGKYTQVRLSIDSAKVTIDGVEYNLEVPSEELKLVKGFTIEDGKTTTLTLDFDAKESIKSSGKDEYKLVPTIKIIEE